MPSETDVAKWYHGALGGWIGLDGMEISERGYLGMLRAPAVLIIKILRIFFCKKCCFFGQCLGGRGHGNPTGFGGSRVCSVRWCCMLHTAPCETSGRTQPPVPSTTAKELHNLHQEVSQLVHTVSILVRSVKRLNNLNSHSASLQTIISTCHVSQMRSNKAEEAEIQNFQMSKT